MADGLQGVQTTSAALDPSQQAGRGPRREELVRAAQVAREAEVRQSPNGLRFATFGETGVPGTDLDRMLEAVPPAIGAALGANTYYFVPLALRESAEPTQADEPEGFARKPSQSPEHAMVARAWSDELGESAICHRNVELGSGHRGVFISTRLMGDRFALSFEFFINVAHAFVDAAGVPESFATLVWQQAVDGVRGETSLDAWESRNLAFGREPNANGDEPKRRNQTYTAKSRPFSAEKPALSAAAQPLIDEKERGVYMEAAFSDAVAIYLLSLALDFDYSELREREYPLLAPAALAARLKLVAELFPPNPGYQFSIRYRRRA
ncbi:MAG TPA: hypothetical protein VFA99_16200 [Acidobacteriaceae bacterium]|nr:hypothetical protein [Acidobacteriaceae bacterium]